MGWDLARPTMQKWEEFIGIWRMGRITALNWEIDDEIPVSPGQFIRAHCICPMVALGYVGGPDDAEALHPSDPVALFAEWFDSKVKEEYREWAAENERVELDWEHIDPVTKLTILGRDSLVRATISKLSTSGFAPEGYTVAQAASDIDRITTGIEAIL